MLLLAAEPRGWPVAAFIVALGVASAALGALILLRVATPPRRGARARTATSRALRRGIEFGAVVGIVAALQVARGLTPLTALFVILSFAVAEYLLSAERSSSR